MSKNACELVQFKCPHSDRLEHVPFSKENPSFLITGDVVLLPRLYKTDSNYHPRKFGVCLPINCCTQCWSKLNFPDTIKSTADEFSHMLQLETDLIENDKLPVAKREVLCNNASHILWHKDENSIGKTHDIIGRALFTIQPLEYLSYVDYNVYQGTGKPMNAYTFELELDFCFHCLDQAWKAVETSKLDKLVARFKDEKSPDPRKDPNFAATFNYFQGLTGG